MALALYLDECVHEVILHALRTQGVQVTSVRERGLQGQKDEAVFRDCAELGYCLVTYDSDFLKIASEWMHDGRRFHGLIHARGNRLTMGTLIQDLTLVAHASTADEVLNHVIHIPLRG